jgi:hypothetical protein
VIVLKLHPQGIHRCLFKFVMGKTPWNVGYVGMEKGELMVCNMDWYTFLVDLRFAFESLHSGV